MVEGYLAHKWGLSSSLPNFHPFKNSLTTPVNKVITSATTANATVGSSFSYSILTNVTNPAFEAANLPPGLTCNTGTGVISGTPLAGGSYVVTLVAQSASSNEYATSTLTLSIPVSAPLLSVETPGNLVMNGAKLKGNPPTPEAAMRTSRSTGETTTPAPTRAIGTAITTLTTRERSPSLTTLPD